MNNRHELGLLENAIDSLKEALSKYQEGLNGNQTAFKFCILHLAHFFELLFKHYVALAHPLLIYKNPFARNLDRNTAFTITLDDAVHFLKNQGNEISSEFEDDLNALKKLRNQIEHHKFSMDLSEVKAAVGRLIAAINSFDEAHAELGIGELVDPVNSGLFDELANTYRAGLKKALAEVEVKREMAFAGLRHKYWSTVEFAVFNCPNCEHDTFITNAESETGFECTFCGNSDSDEIDAYCDVCENQWTAGDLTTVPDYHGDGQKVNVCPRCMGDPDYIDD
jgi:tetratricopeptide (TPR) repeat protein